MTAIDRKPFIAKVKPEVNERIDKVRYAILAELAYFISRNSKQALIDALEIDEETLDDWFANRRSFTLSDITDIERVLNIQIIARND